MPKCTHDRIFLCIAATLVCTWKKNSNHKPRACLLAYHQAQATVVKNGFKRCILTRIFQENVFQFHTYLYIMYCSSEIAIMEKWCTRIHNISYYLPMYYVSECCTMYVALSSHSRSRLCLLVLLLLPKYKYKENTMISKKCENPKITLHFKVSQHCLIFHMFHHNHSL